MKKTIDRLVLYLVYTSAATLAGLLLAEAVARAIPAREEEAWASRHAQSEAYSYFDWRADFFVDVSKTSRRLFYEPYSLWRTSDVETKTINIKDGYRFTWTPAASEEKEDYLIFCFGGSTLMGAGAPDDLTIPSYLARWLNHDHARYRYVVKNYSASGFLSDNEVHLLVKLLRSGARPDGVIFYDGANEVFNKVAKGQPHYLYENFRQLGSRYSIRDFLIRVASRSRLLQRLSMMTDEHELVADREVLWNNSSAMFREYSGNVELVRALGLGYGFSAAFFWQPNLYDTGKVLTTDERRIRNDHGLRAAFEVVRDLIDEVDPLKEDGVMDLSSALDGVQEAIFLDFCHITPIGNEAVAREMLPVLVRLSAAGEDVEPQGSGKTSAGSTVQVGHP